jgi:hypothetical protein
VLSGRRGAGVYVPNTYPDALPEVGAAAGEEAGNAKTPPERGFGESG